MIETEPQVRTAMLVCTRRVETEHMSRWDEVPLLLRKVKRSRARLEAAVLLRLGEKVSDRDLGALLARLVERERPISFFPPPVEPAEPVTAARLQLAGETVANRPMTLEWFAVRLEYREPTHELWTGEKRIHRLSIDVQARSEAEARRNAERALFKRSAESGVGWVPELVSAQVFAGRAPLSNASQSLTTPSDKLQGFNSQRIELRVRNWPKVFARHERSEFIGGVVAIAELHERAEARQDDAIKVLLELSEELTALGRQPHSFGWVNDLAFALSREAWELATDVKPGAELDVSFRVGTELDFSPSRIGSVVAAFRAPRVSTEVCRAAERFIARIAVLLQWMAVGQGDLAQ